MSTAAARDVTQTLQGAVGSDYVRAASAADAIRGVTPRFVVEPADAQQLSRVLAIATDYRLAVIPRGGGTKLDWGNPPTRADLIVSTARMSAVVEHPWADLTVTVQAGCTIAALQDALRTHGQRIAADPLWPERATVGGMLATNDTGAFRLRFGGLRDLVIGTTLVLPDGTVASSGGKVVKNVAGYDLSKLATGALGTLGVITTAIFRLHPAPVGSRTLSREVPSLGAAQRVVDAVLDSQLAASAMQVRSIGSTTSVDVLFEGSAAALADQVARLAAVTSAAFQDEPSPVWQARQELWASPTSVVVKVTTLPASIGESIERIHRAAHARGCTAAAVFAATGIGWARLDGAPGHIADVVRDLREQLASSGGAVVVLKPIDGLGALDAWGPTGDAAALMAAVKQRFDPNGTLNGGRFVDRI